MCTEPWAPYRYIPFFVWMVGMTKMNHWRHRRGRSLFHSNARHYRDCDCCCHCWPNLTDCSQANHLQTTGRRMCRHFHICPAACCLEILHFLSSAGCFFLAFSTVVVGLMYEHYWLMYIFQKLFESNRQGWFGGHLIVYNYFMFNI